MSEQRKKTQDDGGASKGIAWTEQTWNPIRGCSKVSAGCKNCYAEKMAARFCGPGQPYEGVSDGKRWTGDVVFVIEHLIDPLRWTKARLVFTNSMSDLFHEGLNFHQIGAIFAVMAASPTHTFQVLTKRPARMLEFFAWLEAQMRDTWHPHGNTMQDDNIARMEVLRGCFGMHSEGRLPSMPAVWPLPNVWLGVSTEDQAAADERIPLLLKAPAAVRWISAEPLIGPLYLRNIFLAPRDPKSNGTDDWDDPDGGKPRLNALAGYPWHNMVYGTSRGEVGPRLDWVVVGGESGPGARSCGGDWLRQIVRDCQREGVPVFVKQLGAAYHDPENGLAGHSVKVMDGEKERLFTARRLTHPKGGDVSEWPRDLSVREWPKGYSPTGAPLSRQSHP